MMTPLTDEQIRVKVATLLLGEPIRTQEAEWLYWLMPNGKWIKVPDYTEDLNACAEMRKSMSPDEQYRFGAMCADEVRRPELEAAKRDGQDEDDQFPLNGIGHFAIVNLDARTQSIIFLRVKGVIKEEKV